MAPVEVSTTGTRRTRAGGGANATTLWRTSFRREILERPKQAPDLVVNEQEYGRLQAVRRW